ncbi:MAG: ATP-binding protein [Candidatus Micrarchaeia archaeon]|jgi:ATP-dependent DNA helicase RecG
MTFSFSDLQKWVSEGEGPAMEFKSSVQKNAGETVSAFANSYGGIMVFGVEPKKKELAGLRDADEESQRLRAVLEDCRPRPLTEQLFVRQEGKTFIVLKVELLGYSNPCFYSKRCFVRQGTTNLELAGEDLIDFLRRRAVLNFEEMKSPAKLSDLDPGKLDAFFKARGTPVDVSNEEELKARLVGLKAAAHNGSFYLKNLAAMFFAKDAQAFFNNVEARIVVYSGREKGLETIRSDKRIAGTVPELIDGAFKAVSGSVGRSQRLVGAKREELLDYPIAALREAITNAVGHRDYFDSMPCLIELFEDRLVITNPGSLLPGQTISNFDKNPKHRNPLTYRLLDDLKLGEGLGTGIEKMRKQCRLQGLPDPEFYNVGNAFQVVFYNDSSGKKRHPAEYENVRQMQALAYLQKNAQMKAAQYAKFVGVSVPTAINDLNELAKQGKIRRVGKFRGAYYELKKL